MFKSRDEREGSGRRSMKRRRKSEMEIERENYNTTKVYSRDERGKRKRRR